jgi:membrane protease YdiL (CAAX protease family)
MTSHSGLLVERRVSGASTALVTLLIAIGACAVTLAIAILNSPYFDLVNRFVGATGAEARGLLFSSWLVVIGVPFVVRDPKAFGFTLGDIGRHWRLVVAMLVAAAGVTGALLLLVTGPIPYSDASAFIETVDVPITEELVFRAVLVTGLLSILVRVHGPRAAATLAILIDGLAFGLAHVANAANLDLTFVLSQATFATVLGIGCAYLMLKTRSVYPAILLHAVVNAVVVTV